MKSIELTFIGSAKLESFARKAEKLYSCPAKFYLAEEWSLKSRRHQIIITDSEEVELIEVFKKSSNWSFGIGGEEKALSFIHLGLGFIHDDFKFDSVGGFRKFCQVLQEHWYAKKSLFEFNQKIASLGEQIKEQLGKTKKLHKKTIPLRYEKFQALECISKYVVGMATGGEFFDSFEIEGHLIFIAFASDRYLESANVMKWNLQLKQKSKRPSLSEMIQEIQEYGLDDKLEGDLIIIDINLKSYSLEGVGFGSYEVLSGDEKTLCFENQDEIRESLVDSLKFSYTLDRGERLMITSPGFRKNWLEQDIDRHYAKYFRENGSAPLNELIHDILYRLHIDDNQSVLSYDASIVLMEVGQNAIIPI